MVFGQLMQYRYEEPQKMGSEVNTEADESYPLVSSNGTLFFVRSLSELNTGGKKAGQDIWMIPTENGSAVNMNALNNLANNAIVGMSADNSHLYLLNIYKSEDKMKPGISVCSWNGSSAGTPEALNIPSLEIKGDFYGFWMNPEGDTLLISMNSKESRGQEDIYVCLKKDGKWQSPINLGSMINSSGFELSPFLGDDGKTLFFASNGKGGWGDADIFVSYRQDDSWTRWTYPKNLGKPINSKGYDAFYFERNNKAYFSSNRDGGLGDIFEVTFKKIAAGKKFAEDIPKPMSLYFDLNSYMLSNANKKTLSEVVQLMDDDYDLKLTISGYTCTIGDNETNEKLSALRAESVMTYLVIMGIDEDRLTVRHFGERAANDLTRKDHDKALDRKVELKFSY